MILMFNLSLMGDKQLKMALKVLQKWQESKTNSDTLMNGSIFDCGCSKLKIYGLTDETFLDYNFMQP